MMSPTHARARTWRAWCTLRLRLRGAVRWRACRAALPLFCCTLVVALVASWPSFKGGCSTPMLPRQGCPAAPTARSVLSNPYPNP